jgi:hypothetical protein
MPIVLKGRVVPISIAARVDPWESRTVLYVFTTTELIEFQYAAPEPFEIRTWEAGTYPFVGERILICRRVIWSVSMVRILAAIEPFLS